MKRHSAPKIRGNIVWALSQPIFEDVDRLSALVCLAVGCRFGTLAQVAYADGDVGHSLVF